ncbi:hypothetical protein ACIGKL_24400 [Pseudomonas sp. NPDC077186]|uniref:hypothetical protein n=1 Tax=Pseudomonas sp. NPDC077186 TaxID=3364421 RepID=UPI0037C95233
MSKKTHFQLLNSDSIWDGFSSVLELNPDTDPLAEAERLEELAMRASSLALELRRVPQLRCQTFSVEHVVPKGWHERALECPNARVDVKRMDSDWANLSADFMQAIDSAISVWPSVKRDRCESNDPT